MTTITTSDILDALRGSEIRERTPDRPKGVFTAREAAAAKGVSLVTIHRWLRRMAAEGRLDVLSFQGQRINGSAYPITAYRLKKK